MIVWSKDPDTIKAPFGENWVDVTKPLWAFCFPVIIIMLLLQVQGVVGEGWLESA